MANADIYDPLLEIYSKYTTALAPQLNPNMITDQYTVAAVREVIGLALALNELDGADDE